MGSKSNEYSKLEEEKIFEELLTTLGVNSANQKFIIFDLLNELQKRIESNSIQNIDRTISVLLDVAKKRGDKTPDSIIVINLLCKIIEKNDSVFQNIFSELENNEQLEEERLFLVFSKLVEKLETKKQKEAIPLLVAFLIRQENVNRSAVRVVYELLVNLGNRKAGKIIVENISPYLNSNLYQPCAIIYSVKLCSKFADVNLMEKILEVLKKSIDGFYDAYSTEIEKDICEYLGRVKDRNSIFHLIMLLKNRYKYGTVHISKALAQILDSHPYASDDLIDELYKTEDQQFIDAILRSFEEQKEPKLDSTKLLSKIRIKWWHAHPTNMYIRFIFKKMGDNVKPTLFKILENDSLEEEKYDFVLDCLKEIGVSDKELYKLFNEPILFQVHNFFYPQNNLNLSTLWKEKTKLGNQIAGKPKRLDYLIEHIFLCFNFPSMNVDPSNREVADIVCLHPTSLELLIIGCTTGVLKDDLQKMDALIGEMTHQIPSLSQRCTISPIIVYTKNAAIHPSDKKYATQQGIVIMQSHDIDRLLKMLKTGRNSFDVLKYIEKVRLSQLSSTDNPYS